MNSVQLQQKRNYTEERKQLLKQFFSRKDVSMLFLVLAIILKTALTFYYFQFDTDKLYQAIAAKNLVQGHGITINQVHATDLSKEYYEPMVGWPPGYTLIVAPIYKITNDLVCSCIIVDILSIIFFFIIFRALLIALRFPQYLINLLVLFNGADITISIRASAPTDLLGLDFILYYIYLQLSLFNGRKSASKTVWSAIVNLCPAWLRYMYIPTTFVVPIVLLWMGWHKKEKEVFRSGIVQLVFAIIGIALLLIFQTIYTGKAGYILPTQKGIYFANLMLAPVVFSAFMNLDFYFMTLSSLSTIKYTTWVAITNVCNMLLAALIIGRFCLYAYKTKLIAKNNWQFFVITSALLGLLVVAELAYLSLTNSAYHPPPCNTMYWTYIRDGRYYILPALLLTLVATNWLFNNTHPFKIKRGLQYLLLFLLFVEIAHGFYFLKKNFTFDRRNYKEVVGQKKLYGYINNIITENKKRNIDVVVTNGANSAARAVLMDAKGLIAQQELNTTRLYAPKPTLVVFISRLDHMAFYKPFISNNPLQFKARIHDFNVYTYLVNPQ